ncbi:hypothetical protein [Hallella sp.]|uniref:hypothetical protein n=1 Tax=Hallella sp. TaxID=2980186 RepID=UPI00307A6E8B
MGKMRYICRVNAYVMNCRYFRVMPNAYEEEGGIVISPDVNACPHVYDGEDVERGKVFVYELRDGKYCPYLMGPWAVNLVDENLKTLLDEYVAGIKDKDNPLSVSKADIKLSVSFFDSMLDILVVKTANGIESGVYRINTNGNGLAYPGNPIFKF